MATHSSILACKIPWTEEPGGLQSMGLQKVRYDLSIKQQQQNLKLVRPASFSTVEYLSFPYLHSNSL